jgi:hypothetical protein
MKATSSSALSIHEQAANKTPQRREKRRRRRSEEEEEEEEEAKKGINARIHEDRKHWKEGERTRFATA